jgi:putative ABC transport system permease protein
MDTIARRMLFSDRGKLLTALIGVVFAVVLVNVQAGLFLGFISRAGLLVDHGQADIWVGHRKMHNVDFPQDIPRRWIQRLRGIPGVVRAKPYVIGWTSMTLPSGGYEDVVVVGVDRKSFLGHAWNFTHGGPEAILRTDGIMVDECEAEKLEHPEIGELRELGGVRARVVGTTRGVMGFLVAPYVFTTYDRACRYLDKSPEACSYYLIQVASSADADAVCAEIRQRVPEVDAYRRDDYGRISVNFWMTRTGLGISFGAATLLGLLVGLIMVAQTLYAMVLDRLGEFGTLKAIGARESQIFGVLFAQAVIMAVVGSLIGLAIVWCILQLFSTPRAPIVIPSFVAMGSCALVLGICLVSAWLPYQRIRNVDPMMVLQS